ncbi:MAG: hypothetical protein HPY76_09410 [Anaerolineae bacterium]|nr:hypothetical protein [Anaerolineae bacterium]
MPKPHPMPRKLRWKMNVVANPAAPGDHISSSTYHAADSTPPARMIWKYQMALNAKVIIRYTRMRLLLSCFHMLALLDNS